MICNDTSVAMAEARVVFSRPADGERVDLLRADVASEDRRAIRCDTDFSTTYLNRIHHATKVFQTGNGLDLTVGESQALHLGVRASSRKSEILAIRRNCPVHEVAGGKLAPFLSLAIEDQQLRGRPREPLLSCPG